MISKLYVNIILMFYSFLQDVNIKNEIQEFTESLLQKTMGNILDFKCFVAGGTRVFLLSLGVSFDQLIFLLFPILDEI